MTTELDTRIAELEAKLNEFRSHGEHYEEWNAVQAELEHLKEQKILIQGLSNTIAKKHFPE